MKMVLDFLNEINCKKIELDASNPPAIKLYEKFGFIKNDIKYKLQVWKLTIIIKNIQICIISKKSGII